MRLRSLAVAFVLVSMLAPVPALADTPPSVANATDQADQQPQQPANFDGVWEGKILYDKEAFISDTATPAAGEPMRLEIHDAVVRVFIAEQEGAPLTEFIPGSFHIAPVMANAVISATQYSAVWTETWTFVVTKKDNDTLIVNFVRVVNNNVPLSQPESKFFTRGYGEFKLVKS
jgi:hypothetical protein